MFKSMCLDVDSPMYEPYVILYLLKAAGQYFYHLYLH